MPSSNFSKFSDAFRKRAQRLSSSKGQIENFVDHSRIQTKLLILPFKAIADSNRFVKPASLLSNLHITSQKKNFSFIGAFPRAPGLPSISEPTHYEKTAAVALLDFQIPVTDCNLISRLTQSAVLANSSTTSCSRRNVDNSRNASMDLRIKDQHNKFSMYGYFFCIVAKRRGIFSPYGEYGLRAFHSASQACPSAGTAPDMSFDKSMRDKQLSSPAVTSSEKIPAVRFLKLNSGSCYLPHPDKEETGGEDAHFICGDDQAIGVADGVGGWADIGVDAGYYARELMSNSVTAIEEEPKGSIDPARVLEKAYASTKSRGSSTACIVALTDQGLHAINLGDSGFMVIRGGSTVFRSPVQQHDFNFTYQLESGNAGDLPSSGQVFTIAVAPGDVMIAGSDGLFDNLYINDITEVVVHAVRAGLGPQVTAQQIASLARQRAQDKNRQTPFSTAAQNAGFRYHGGKLDDITVVVSYIISENKEVASAGGSS